MSPEKKTSIESAEKVILSFEGNSVELEKRLVPNANLEDAFTAVQIVRDASLTLLDPDKALKEIGLGGDEEVKLLYDYLGQVIRKKRGRGHEFEINQIKMVYEALGTRFPDLYMSQLQERGGGSGKKDKTKKRQSGGYEPVDYDY